MYAFPGCFIFAWIGFFPNDAQSSVCLLASFDWWSVCSENISVCLLSSYVYYANSAVSAAAQLCMFATRSFCFCSWGKWSFNEKFYFYCFEKWSFNMKLYFTAFGWGHSTTVGAEKLKMHASSHLTALIFFSNVYLILHAVCYSHTTKKFATEISKSGTSSSVARTRPGFLICEISKTSRVRSTFCKHVI